MRKIIVAIIFGIILIGCSTPPLGLSKEEWEFCKAERPQAAKVFQWIDASPSRKKEMELFLKMELDEYNKNGNKNNDQPRSREAFVSSVYYLQLYPIGLDAMTSDDSDHSLSSRILLRLEKNREELESEKRSINNGVTFPYSIDHVNTRIQNIDMYIPEFRKLRLHLYSIPIVQKP